MKSKYLRDHEIRDTRVIAAPMGSGMASSMSVRFDFINTTQLNICVKSRDGACFTIQPTMAHYDTSQAGGLYVRKTYRFDSSRVNLNTQDLLDKGLGFNSEERAELLKAYENALFLKRQSNSFNPDIEFHVDHKVLHDDIIKFKAIYARRVDFLFCKSGDEGQCQHPYSEEGYQERMFGQEEVENEGNQLQTSYFVVDHQDRYGYKYFNLNGEVFQLNVVRKSEFEDGVYVYRAGHVVNGHPSPPTMKRLDFEQAAKELNIYCSYTDAVAAGGLKEQIERQHELEMQELRVSDMENRKEKASIEKAKLKLETEKARVDERLSELEQENKRLSLKLTEVKLAHEDRNLIRDQRVKQIEHDRKMAAAELDMVVDNVKANNAVTTSHAKASVESAKAANSTGSEVLKFLTVVSAAALLGVKVYKHK